ncbi:hypothetical protein TESG_03215 [Trichophyton tonsurans CBS 112818]|uniref:Uncharacterized protein n=2 Tax=Trichophyton TaxID=5550 RepID=F2Q4Y2_TRIEC|nr:hypothetical protein TESG_03215 [Trichophyton tonsurans CBS 112818]EGE09200.1 hypothetical protein TEQG_08015 [Trichophyton equinum CBS 127.97]
MVEPPATSTPYFRTTPGTCAQQGSSASYQALLPCSLSLELLAVFPFLLLRPRSPCLTITGSGGRNAQKTNERAKAGLKFNLNRKPSPVAPGKEPGVRSRRPNSQDPRCVSSSGAVLLRSLPVIRCLSMAVLHLGLHGPRLTISLHHDRI